MAMYAIIMWMAIYCHFTLQWRHNGRDGVSNQQHHHCLFSRLFRRRSKLRVTGLYAGNSPVTGEFPAQMACNAENISIWWRHHDLLENVGSMRNCEHVSVETTCRRFCLVWKICWTINPAMNAKQIFATKFTNIDWKKNKLFENIALACHNDRYFIIATKGVFAIFTYLWRFETFLVGNI